MHESTGGVGTKITMAAPLHKANRRLQLAVFLLLLLFTAFAADHQDAGRFLERMAVADQLGNRGMFAHGSAITTLHGRPHPASCDLIRQRPDRIYGV